jgi:hypothetical protein
MNRLGNHENHSFAGSEGLNTHYDECDHLITDNSFSSQNSDELKAIERHLGEGDSNQDDSSSINYALLFAEDDYEIPSNCLNMCFVTHII